jgi:hypothetical protein
LLVAFEVGDGEGSDAGVDISGFGGEGELRGLFGEARLTELYRAESEPAVADVRADRRSASGRRIPGA